MTDREFADFLRSVPREVSPAEVERRVHERDLAEGEYVNHNATYHHFGEGAH